MKQQINALTATRAVAALMVVIHHFGYQIYPFSLIPSLFHSGNLAIGYFFVLSGFVLFFSYSDTKIVYLDYLKRRIARIAPVYWLALFLFLVVAFTCYQYTFSSSLVKQVAYCALFLQAYFHNYALALNSPSWTISVEMLFYLLFPLLLLIQQKNIRVFVAGTIVLFLCSQFVHLKNYHPGMEWSKESEGPAFYHPFIHLSQFLAGMIGGYLYPRVKRVSAAAPAALLAIIVVFVVFRPAGISYHAGLLDPLFMLLIVAIAVRNPRALNLKGFVFLGEVSYGIYILQWPVFKFLEAMNGSLHIPQPYFFIAAVAVLIATASLSYLFFEKPLRSKINALRFGTGR